jgi:hypothetical protein
MKAAKRSVVASNSSPSGDEEGALHVLNPEGTVLAVLSGEMTSPRAA